MAISTVAKDELRQRIEDELEAQFGTSQLPATLNKYAIAMSEAIAEELFKHGYFPDDQTYPPPP
jgi:hypothetical protein